jgi:chitinase
MASSHYANSVQNLLIETNIPFISKSENVANVSEIRSIEDLWSYLKRQVYQDGWKAENLDQLKKKITKCIRNI